MNIFRAVPCRALRVVFGVVIALAISSCATVPPDDSIPFEYRVVASCMIEGDNCIVTLENHHRTPVPYFLLTSRTQSGTFSRTPFFSMVLLRNNIGETRECHGSMLISDSLSKPVNMQLLAPHSVKTITLPLSGFWAMHQPGWGYPTEGAWGSIDELRANKIQYKICVAVYFEPELKNAISCDTGWRDF